MTAPGKPLDLDGMEAVARAAVTASAMPSMVWAKCPTTCSESVDRCIAAGKCLREGTPYLSPAGSPTLAWWSPPPPAIDPPTVLALIQMQRELVGALTSAAAQFRHYEALHAGKGTPDGDSKAITNRGFANVCEAALTKALGEQPL